MKILLIMGSYLLGSVPFAYIITRLRAGIDIREAGSKNVGATNALRTAGKLAGFLTLVLDMAKGIVAVEVGKIMQKDPASGALCGFAAMVGHSYPVFLAFRGGKSVATGAGSFLVLSPLSIISCVAVFLFLLFSFRIVSLASMIASASFPLFAWLYGGQKGVVLWGAVSAAWIIFRHRPNIIRLFQGTEKRIGEPGNA